MGTNTRAVRSLIGGGLLAFAAILALCAAAWAPSAYADELVANQGEIAVANDADGIALKSLSWSYIDKTVDLSTITVAGKLELDKPKNVVLEKGEVKWFTFAPSQDGAYAFSSTDCEDDACGTFYEVSEDNSNELVLIEFNSYGSGAGNFYISSELSAGKTYYLACSNSMGNSDAYNVTVSTAVNNIGDEYAFGYEINSYMWPSDTAVTLERLRFKLYACENGEPVTQLKYGSDYEVAGWYQIDESANRKFVSVAAPSQTGEYFVKIIGKGSYNGATYCYFTIADSNDLNEYHVDSKRYVPFTGKAVTLEDLAITLYRYDEVGNRVALPSSAYVVDNWYSWSVHTRVDEAVDLGDYEVRIKGTGSFEGTGLRIPFYIVEPNSIKVATVTGIDPAYVYGGTPIELKPTVTMPGGKVLVEGTDYSMTVTREYGTEYTTVSRIEGPGRYEIELTGIEGDGGGGYIGETFVYFNVYDESDSVSLANDDYVIAGVDASYPYTGSEIKPPVTVRYFANGDAYDLVEGRDYTVAYKDNVTGSTATVIVTGQGRYKDSLTKTFAITGAPAPKPTPKPTPAPGIDVGKTAKVGGATYKVTDNSKSTVVFQNAPKSKKTVVIPATVRINGKAYAVVGIAKGAFKGAKARTVKIKTKRLAKKSVKGCFKGAKKLKTVKVKVGKKKVNKKFVKKYKKIFTEKNCGANVAVK